MFNLTKGFNLIKIYTEKNIGSVNIFSCDIKCDQRLDFNLVCLNSNNRCISEKTEEIPYIWYNEISNTSNYKIKYFVITNCNIYLTCYSPGEYVITLNNIQVNKLSNLDINDFNLNNPKFYDFEKYKYKNKIQYIF